MICMLKKRHCIEHGKLMGPNISVPGPNIDQQQQNSQQRGGSAFPTAIVSVMMNFLHFYYLLSH